MIIDHIGLFFFPNILLFRIIGRLSFPLFAWLIASGSHHSRNINKYLFRILILAIVSQIPYIIAIRQVNSSFYDLNIVFTLFLGLLAIKFIKQTENKYLWVATTIILATIADVFQVDAGALGVVSIVAFYIFYNNKTNIVISQTLIFSAFCLVPALINIYNSKLISFLDFWNLLEMASLASLLFVILYNKKQGPKIKYWFYVLYPLQFAILYLLKILKF